MVTVEEMEVSPVIACIAQMLKCEFLFVLRRNTRFVVPGSRFTVHSTALFRTPWLPSLK